MRALILVALASISLSAQAAPILDCKFQMTDIASGTRHRATRRIFLSHAYGMQSGNKGHCLILEKSKSFVADELKRLKQEGYSITYQSTGSHPFIGSAICMRDVGLAHKPSVEIRLLANHIEDDEVQAQRSRVVSLSQEAIPSFGITVYPPDFDRGQTDLELFCRSSETGH